MRWKRNKIDGEYLIILWYMYLLYTHTIKLISHGALHVSAIKVASEKVVRFFQTAITRRMSLHHRTGRLLLSMHLTARVAGCILSKHSDCLFLAVLSQSAEKYLIKWLVYELKTHRRDGDIYKKSQVLLVLGEINTKSDYFYLYRCLWCILIYQY